VSGYRSTRKLIFMPGADPFRAINREQVRRVWAAITLDPHASMLELGALLNMYNHDLTNALQILVDAGYVERDPNRARARRIVVPFVEVPHG
jgi:DNA-binding MarR family transcriptional regulator